MSDPSDFRRLPFDALCGLAGLMLGACVMPNPNYCANHAACIDPTRPFCDVPGEYPAAQGINNVCIPDPHARDAGSDAPAAMDADGACAHCSGEAMCGSDGVCCFPESDAGFCARAGRACGLLTEADNCGSVRTVMCGTCALGSHCSPGGACVCADGPAVTSEQDVDEASPIPVDIERFGSAVACGPDVCLVVWLEDRGARSSPELIATRVALDGTVLDSVGIVVAADVNDRHAPAVAFGAGQFLVVYGQQPVRVDVEAVRIDTDGRVLDPEPIPIPIVDYRSGDCRVAFADGLFVAYWVRDGDVRGARVDTAGRLLDRWFPKTILKGNDAVRFAHPTAAASDDSLLIVANQTVSDGGATSLVATRFRPRGAVVAEPKTIVADVGAFGAVRAAAFDGNNYLVAFSEERERWGTRTYMLQTVSSALTPGASVPLDVHSLIFSLEIAYDGTGFVAVWNRDDDVVARRIGADGSPLGSSYRVLLRSEGVKQYDAPNMGAAAGRIVVASIGEMVSSLERPLIGMVVDGDLDEISAARIWSVRAPRHEEIALGGHDSSYLALWSGGGLHSGSLDVEGNRTGERAVLSTFEHAGDSGVALANAEAGFLVAWKDRDGDYVLRSARLATDGTPAAFPAKPIEPSRDHRFQGPPAVVPSGGQYLVSWIDWSEDAEGIYGARLGADAAPIDASARYIMPADHRGRFALASDGQVALLAWVDSYTRGDEVYASLLNSDGKALNPEGSVVSLAKEEAYDPSAAFNDERYLVAWLAVDGYRILAGRVTKAGVPLDNNNPLTLTGGSPISSTKPHVARYRDKFLVLWAEKHGKRDWRIAAALVDGDGSVTGPQFLDEGLPFMPRRFAVAEGQDGRAMLGYTRLDPAPPYGVERMRTRLLVWNTAETCP